MEQNQHRPDYFLLGMTLGTLFGGVIGGLIALWFAPRSGKQLQTLMYKQGKALRNQADEATSYMVEQLEDAATQASEQVDTLRQDGKQFLNDRVERVN